DEPRPNAGEIQKITRTQRSRARTRQSAALSGLVPSRGSAKSLPLPEKGKSMKRWVGRWPARRDLARLVRVPNAAEAAMVADRAQARAQALAQVLVAFWRWFWLRCEFRRNPAGDSDLKPATVPI